MNDIQHTLGMVYGWCWNRMFGEWNYLRLYWPAESKLSFKRAGYRLQRLSGRSLVIRAGLMDWTRGRHWDRRHRYGVK